MRLLIGFVLGLGLMLILAAAQKTTLEDRVKSLEDRIDLLEGITYANVAAELTVGKSSFSICETSFGSFALRIAAVETFGAGCRVQIGVFNLTSAAVSNSTLDITWKGKRKTVKSKSEEPNTIKPGEWTVIEILNTDIPASELQKLSIIFTPSVLFRSR